MKKWEYKVIQLFSHQKTDETFKQLGEQGWELVAIDSSGHYYFKRPQS
jgi:hypothetical protein